MRERHQLEDVRAVGRIASVEELLRGERAIGVRENRRDDAVRAIVGVAPGGAGEPADLDQGGARRAERELVVERSLVAVLVEVAERARRALLRAEPPRRAAGPVEEVGDFRAIRLQPLHAGGRGGPLHAMTAETELVLAHQLRAVEASLHVPQAIEHRIGADVLDEPVLAERFVVGGAVVRVVERDPAVAPDEGAQVQQSAPQHAAPRHVTRPSIVFHGLAAAAHAGGGALGVGAHFLTIRVRSAEEIPDALPEHRIVAADRHAERAVGRARA